MLTNCLVACAHLSITVSEIQRDICEIIGILSYPLHSTPPLGGFPSEYWHPLWYRKTRMVSLPDGVKISKISLFVLAQLTNVTDAQTDGHRVTAIAALCIASHGKKRRATDHHTVQQYRYWYTGRLWVGCYIWYSDEWFWQVGAPPSPLLAVPNVTAQPSTASVPTSYYLMWHYNCLWTLKG